MYIWRKIRKGTTKFKKGENVRSKITRCYLSDKIAIEGKKWNIHMYTYLFTVGPKKTYLFTDIDLVSDVTGRFCSVYWMGKIWTNKKQFFNLFSRHLKQTNKKWIGLVVLKRFDIFIRVLLSTNFFVKKILFFDILFNIYSFVD